MIDEKDYNCVFDFNGNGTSMILQDGRIVGGMLLNTRRVT